MIKFYEDPEKYPLSTPTGKLEFYSTGLAEHFPDDEERPPVPKWIPQGVSHEETIGTGRSKKYPLLVMSNHPRWGVHSEHDDITWLREIETCKVRGSDGYQYQPLWINPVDAEARGIKKGDIVSIINDRGTVLAGAYVTERIMPGAVGIDHGAKWDPIEPGVHRPRWGHQHHRAPQHHSPRTPPATPSPASWPKWRRPTWRPSEPSIRKPSQAFPSLRRTRFRSLHHGR